MKLSILFSVLLTTISVSRVSADELKSNSYILQGQASYHAIVNAIDDTSNMADKEKDSTRKILFQNSVLELKKAKNFVFDSVTKEQQKLAGKDSTCVEKTANKSKNYCEEVNDQFAVCNGVKYALVQTDINILKRDVKKIDAVLQPSKVESNSVPK